MKKLITFLFIVSQTLIYAQNFTVNELNIAIELNKKGYLDVTEEYDITFSSPSHGIFRDIITKYNFEGVDGTVSDHRIYITKIKVPKRKFSTPSVGMQRMSDQLQIKIGDEDKTVSGKQHYTIKYRVKNALIDNDSIVQFYWNAKPNQWRSNFEKITFSVYTPDGMEVSDKNTFVYSGGIGESEVSGQFDYHYDANVFSGESTAGFESRYGESVTLLIKMPHDLFTNIEHQPSLLSRYGWVGILGVIFAFAGRIWYKNGTSKKVIATTSYYPPKGVDPAMANYILNNKPDNNGLIALIPEWGKQGVLKVREVENSKLSGAGRAFDKQNGKAPSWSKMAFKFVDNKMSAKETQLTKLTDISEEAISYQKRIFNGLFSGRNSVFISDLKDHFYKYMEGAKSDLRNESKIYYDRSSLKRSKYILFGSIGAAIVLGFLFFQFWGPIAVLGNVLFFLVLSLTSKFLVKRNEKGNAALSELKGFKQFIKVAEINRIKMLLEEDPNYFEKTMGYAVAFNLLDKWAGKFDELSIEPPDWYESSAGAFTASSFANSFGHTLTKTQTAMVSSPKRSSSGSGGRSGGGSAGGGFGGGGGGSW